VRWSGRGRRSGGRVCVSRWPRSVECLGMLPEPRAAASGARDAFFEEPRPERARWPRRQFLGRARILGQFHGVAARRRWARRPAQRRGPTPRNRAYLDGPPLGGQLACGAVAYLQLFVDALQRHDFPKLAGSERGAGPVVTNSAARTGSMSIQPAPVLKFLVVNCPACIRSLVNTKVQGKPHRSNWQSKGRLLLHFGRITTTQTVGIYSRIHA